MSSNGASSAATNGLEAGVRNARARQRAVAIGVAPKPPGQGDDALAELKELLRTAGVATAGEMLQVREAPDPDRYFGRGKLAELKAEIKRTGANLVACDDELAPRQERNLEAALDVPVIDRTAIILDIFADHAHSAEGKLQVELAQLEYNLARMRGPVDPPRAPRRRAHGRRHRHPGPGRVADRDRPPPRARPDLGAAPPPRAGRAEPGRDARAARVGGGAGGRARRATRTRASRPC